MSPEDYKKLLSLQVQVEKEAYEILKKYGQFCEELCHDKAREIPFLRFNRLDDNSLLYTGKESGLCGGPAYYELRLPQSYLVNEWEGEVRKRLFADVERQGEYQKKVDEKYEERKRKEYLELKKKFEGEDHD